MDLDDEELEATRKLHGVSKTKNDIEILEKHLEFIKNFDNNSSYIPALENVIAEYKKLKIINKMQEYRITVMDERELIPKSKIREVLKKYKYAPADDEDVGIQFYKELEELLQEK